MVTMTAPTTTAASPERLLSLDVLRGLTMASMVLVNDPGSNAIYTQLDHAEWNGATFTDMIFPCFLVMVGVSMTLSFASRLNRGASHARLAVHALRRGALIVLIGVLLNLVFDWDFAHLRFPGVLQRIGVCYTVAALLYLAIPGTDTGAVAATARGYPRGSCCTLPGRLLDFAQVLSHTRLWPRSSGYLHEPSRGHRSCGLRHAPHLAFRHNAWAGADV